MRGDDGARQIVLHGEDHELWIVQTPEVYLRVCFVSKKEGPDGCTQEPYLDLSDEQARGLCLWLGMLLRGDIPSHATFEIRS